MKKKDASFWSDIKVLDERLSREPDSFCFARLSEIYLKVGLLADALHTARTGVAKHPGYLAGQRALAMACDASGLSDESRVMLERITAAMPEDVDAQKTLARQYVAAGDVSAAMRIYRTVLDFRPDDRASKLELETLQNSDTCSSESPLSDQINSEPVAFRSDAPQDEIIDLSESDIFEEPSEVETGVVTTFATETVTTGHHDPLSTLTLAELYEQQGFLLKALEIYRSILVDDPNNTQLIDKIAQLEGSEPVSENIPEESLETCLEEELDFSKTSAYKDVPVPLEPQPVESVLESTVELTEPELPVTEAFESVSAPFEPQLFEPVTEESVEIVEPELSVPEAYLDVPTPLEAKAFEPLARKSADNVLETLDGWLENIRRIKACR